MDMAHGVTLVELVKKIFIGWLQCRYVRNGNFHRKLTQLMQLKGSLTSIVNWITMQKPLIKKLWFTYNIQN